jgi:hypothetical protein
MVPQLQILESHSVTEYEDAVRREIWRIPPAHEFHGKGVGARDSLIWSDAVKLLEQGESVVFVSNDTNAFGMNGSLSDSLMTEIAGRSANFQYINGLQQLLEVVGAEVFDTPQHRTVEEIAVTILPALMNSPGLFVGLVSLIPRDQRRGAWRSFWDGVYEQSATDKSYAFTLQGVSYAAVTIRFTTTKSFSFVFGDHDDPSTSIWTFNLTGYLTVIGEYNDNGLVGDAEIVNYSISNQESTMQSRTSGPTALVARKREIDRDSDEEYS